jgi:hypothetical protein
MTTYSITFWNLEIFLICTDRFLCQISREGGGGGGEQGWLGGKTSLIFKFFEGAA